MDELALTRIFNKLDKLGEQISDLCNRMTTLEVQHQSHLDGIVDKQNKKMRNRDFAIVIFGLVIGTVEVMRSLGVI